ncbi:Uncharacterized protein FKW44_007443 [Caligus rogercresseyi]|uniref:Uncharacterized protein n=1 Tax=Caligus rogercresseyi TaxID=217165 RepID=A0A7T8KES5_CALRO|nr:Uncharacterized protein FKW44_007443 [Caligus rogercresseyi]
MKLPTKGEQSVKDGPSDRKRRREGHSNETPPSKRTQGPQKPKQKRKFLYAEIAKEANEIVIVRTNGDHISIGDGIKSSKFSDYVVACRPQTSLYQTTKGVNIPTKGL